MFFFIALFSCKKETNPYFSNGTAVTLSSNTNKVAAAPGDSLKNVLALSWTNPKYATDSAHQKFTIEMDSAGRNFADKVTFVVTGSFADSFTAKQLNNVLLNWGFAFDSTYPVDVRVTSSYANNNEAYTSNMVTIQMTPYKIPPKIPVPQNLYIVGDAVAAAPGSGWSNPVNAPYQQLTQIDETTFAGIFNMASGASYLFLPVNGSWDHKYGGSVATGGNLFVDGDVPGSNTPAPATAGWYKIVVNFQTGTYSVTPHVGPSLPDSFATSGSGLWIIGDATPESPAWTNDPTSLQKQQFTRLSNSEYQLKIALSSTGSYLFLPMAGSWDHKYGGATNGIDTKGILLLDGDVPGSNTPAPPTAGTYLIDVNFVTGLYSLTHQ